jgi:hypothetical protein
MFCLKVPFFLISPRLGCRKATNPAAMYYSSAEIEAVYSASAALEIPVQLVSFFVKHRIQKDVDFCNISVCVCDYALCWIFYAFFSLSSPRKVLRETKLKFTGNGRLILAKIPRWVFQSILLTREEAVACLTSCKTSLSTQITPHPLLTYTLRCSTFILSSAGTPWQPRPSSHRIFLLPTATGFHV